MLITRNLVDSRITTEFESMAIPNKIHFGKDIDGKSYTYGDLKTLLLDESKHDEAIDLLYLRLKNILIEPTYKLKKDKDAFLLISVLCNAIEVLGAIFYQTKNTSYKSEGFICVINQLHQKFGRKIKQETKDRLKVMWSQNKEIDKISTWSELIYRYLRNDITHSFVAKGIFLSYEDTDNLKIEENDDNGDVYIVINPSWIWDKYVSVFEDHFKNKVHKKSKLKDKAIIYLETITN